MKRSTKNGNIRLSATFGAVVLGALFSFGAPPNALATEFFVDSATGKDENDGKTPETAWRSLEKVAAAELAPGDAVRFRRGRVWRGTLRAKSGAPGNPILYSDFAAADDPADAPKPRITNAVDLSSPDCWTPIDAQTWATVPDKIVEKSGIGAEDAEFSARFAAGDWRVYTEDDAKAKCAKTVFSELGGVAGESLICEKSGAKQTFLQWTTQYFPVRAGKTVAWRFRAKSTVPFAFGAKAASLFQAQKPWASYGSVLSAPAEIGTDWADYEIVFQTTADADDGRITFFLGGLLPDGARFDFVPGTAREVESKSLRLTADVGNLIFTKKTGNDASSERLATSDAPSPEFAAASKTFPPTWSDREFAGFKRWALDELKEPFDFWFDLETRRVFVRSSENPGETFASVEAALRTNAVVCNAQDVVVENLALTHTAAHGISLAGAARVVIRNCDFDWIGGGDLYGQGGAGKRVRYGNGVEFWESSEDCVVEKCCFSRVYDVATTTQGPSLARSKNLVIRENVIFDCEQSFEIWFSHPETTVEGLRFERNVCVDSGRGWSHRQRPDKRATALLAYSLDAKTVDVTVRQNVFCGTAQRFVWFYRSRFGEYRLDDNVYWAADESVEPRENGDRFFWFDAQNPKDLTFDEFRATTGEDRTSRQAEPKFRDAARNDFEILNRAELGLK